MIDPVSKALTGLLSAQDKLAQAADTVASGDLDPKALVDVNLEATNVKAQSKNLKLMLDQDKAILDILA